ncbi:UbiA family prenyltransferase [Streptomyces sp. NPDC127113]|uniref:UbiA family prenyltransferase n=1 Tax=Streptomyces sp. NPDC127113 TaxID=3345365 RepID=UPI00362BE0F8
MTALHSWAELLRVPALPTTPGDAFAGAAASGLRPGGRTLLDAGASACLYGAGMALNDWADRAEDAVERPHRPTPSGRITPGQALAAATAPTTAGIGLALAALGATAVIGVLTGRGHRRPAPALRARAALAGVYVATAAGPCPHAALNPSPPVSQRAVGGGIRAIVPLQAVLTARSGLLGAAALITVLAPVTRRLGRKVSPT